MPTAFIGLGSNLGNREEMLRRGLEGLRDHGVEPVAASSVYESAPVGKTDQPDFLNAAAEVRTSLDPRELLDAMLAVEAGLGRIRKERWGPRILDLDLLLYEDDIVDEEGLRVPHPLLHERGFVLLPLADLNPRGIHPVLGTPIASLAAAFQTDSSLRKRVEVDLLPTL